MSGGHPFSADRNEVETGGLSDGVDYQHSESDRLYGEASYRQHQCVGCCRSGVSFTILPSERVFADNRLRSRRIYPKSETA